MLTENNIIQLISLAAPTRAHTHTTIPPNGHFIQNVPQVTKGSVPMPVKKWHDIPRII